MSQTNKQAWAENEKKLLMLFLACRVWLFYLHFGTRWGYDVNAFIKVSDAITWSNPFLPLRELFYAYHPPLSFLLVHSITALTGADTHTVSQCMVFAASLSIFLFLRATLKHLHLLDTAKGVIFLYVLASIPLQILLATAINIDVFIFAFTSAAVFFSVRFFWPKTKKSKAQTARYALVMTLLLTCALYTKFSGLIVLCVPVLTAILGMRIRPNTSNVRTFFDTAFKAALPSLIAVMIAFPMYYTRYYKTEGTFFPSNLSWLREEQLHNARIERDKNKAQFFMNLFSPPVSHAADDIRTIDRRNPRLSDTWNQFWVRDEYLDKRGQPLSVSSLQLSALYLSFAHFFVLIGLAAFLRNLKKVTIWEKFGCLLLSYCALQMTAQLMFIYSHPFAAWPPTKAIYVTPLMLGIAYLIANGSKMVPQKTLRVPLLFSVKTHDVLMGATALFVMLNHTLPLY